MARGQRKPPANRRLPPTDRGRLEAARPVPPSRRLLARRALEPDRGADPVAKPAPAADRDRPAARGATELECHRKGEIIGPVRVPAAAVYLCGSDGFPS